MTYCPPRSTILQNFSPIAQTVFEICVTKLFQSLALIFDPSRSCKVKFDDANRKPVGPTYKCSRICHRFRDISSQNFDCWPFDFGRVTPGPKVSKSGGDLLSTSTIRQNFSPIAQTVYEICITKVFHFLAPGGLKTEKQTVTDISPACLSACGDNKWRKHGKITWSGMQTRR